MNKYWNNRNSVKSKIHKPSQNLKKDPFKPINKFLIFQYSCINNSVKRGICRTFGPALERGWLWIFCASVKARALMETEKIACEYWNNRNWLMSKSEPFLQKIEDVPHHFLLFHINALIPPWIKGFSGLLYVRLNAFEFVKMTKTEPFFQK